MTRVVGFSLAMMMQPDSMGAATAPFDGVVAEFNVAVGDQVTDGAVLAVVKAEGAGE